MDLLSVPTWPCFTCLSFVDLTEHEMQKRPELEAKSKNQSGATAFSRLFLGLKSSTIVNLNFRALSY